MSKKTPKRSRDAFEENGASERPGKRSRPASKGTQIPSKLYEDLAAESDEARLNAAKEIIVRLSPENEPDAKVVQTALDRLIRGLCSQRKAVRFGFCVTLTELLRQLFDHRENFPSELNLSAESVIELVDEKTKVGSNVSGQERRDHLIGKLFGCKAVIQSSILTQPKLLLGPWQKVLDHIFKLARDIPWLREECGLILCEALESSGNVPIFEEYARAVVERLSTFQLADTPEGIAIWLTVKRFNDDILPERIWHNKDPLSKKDRSKLVKALIGHTSKSLDGEDRELVKPAAANATPSFAWDIVVSQILAKDEHRRSKDGESTKLEFAHFWIDAVDNTLFSTSSSHERKACGFKLFAKTIGTAPIWAISTLFSPNLIRTLRNQSKKEDRFLHAAALATFKAIQARVEYEPASAAPVVKAMTSTHAAHDFETAQKTKTLEAVLSGADGESLRQIIQHFRALILRPDTEDQSIADARRQKVADLLLQIVRGYKQYEGFSPSSETKWLQDLLMLLVETAYFVPTPKAKTKRVPLPPVTDITRQVFRDRLSSCLTRLLRLDIESRASFAVQTVGLIRSTASNSKDLELVFKADDGVLKTVEKAFQTLDAIAAKGSLGGNKSAAQGFMLLYSLALLQVYDGDGDAVLMLDDLDAARKALVKSKKEQDEAAQDPFVEIILSFLGNSRALFRRIAEEAFSIFISGITSEGLQSLTDILDTEESLTGQSELFAQGDDDTDHAEPDEDEEDEDDDDDVEVLSDVEMINGESQGSDEESGESSDSSSEVDDEDGGSSEDEEVAQFENLLAQTLQTSKPRLDGNTSDDSSEDSDMDDEQMEALDPHLTKIFQQRSKTSKKKQNAEAKRNMVQFKSKVLDLLAIYVDKEYSNVLTLEIILPVLRRIRANANKQLAEKSAKLLKSYFDARSHHKAPLPKPDDPSEAWNILSAIHEEVKLGGGSNLHATACSSASLHLVKVLVSLDRDNYDRLVDIYAETQKAWFKDRKSPIQPVLFTQFQNWSVQKK